MTQDDYKPISRYNIDYVTITAVYVDQAFTRYSDSKTYSCVNKPPGGTNYLFAHQVLVLPKMEGKTRK